MILSKAWLTFLNTMGLAPAGGTANQVLKKDSGTDYNYSWQDESGGGDIFIPAQVAITGTFVINWLLGETFYRTLLANEIYTFSNVADSMHVDVVLTTTGAHTVTWPVGILWPGGAAPIQTDTGTDFYSFKQVDGVIYGFQAIQMS